MSELTRSLFLTSVADKLASDDYTMPIALGSGATVAGLGLGPLLDRWDRLSSPNYRYPKAVEKLTDAMTDASFLADSLVEAEAKAFRSKAPADAAAVDALKARYAAAKNASAEAWQKYLALEKKAGEAFTSRLVNKIQQIPGYRALRIAAPVIGLGGAIYTGHQLYNRYQDQKPWYKI